MSQPHPLRKLCKLHNLTATFAIYHTKIYDVAKQYLISYTTAQYFWGGRVFLWEELYTQSQKKPKMESFISFVEECR